VLDAKTGQIILYGQILKKTGVGNTKSIYFVFILIKKFGTDRSVADIIFKGGHKLWVVQIVHPAAVAVRKIWQRPDGLKMPQSLKEAKQEVTRVEAVTPLHPRAVAIIR
jgi:hypothetical protein